MGEVSRHPVTKLEGPTTAMPAKLTRSFREMRKRESAHRAGKSGEALPKTREDPERAATEVVPSRGFRLSTSLAGSGATVLRTALAGRA